MQRLMSLSIVFVTCWAALHASNTRAETWVVDSFEDFTQGSLDAAGQNLYVCRDGAVRAIHRFDLNDDGWIDLLFNGTHDLIGILPSTSASLDAAGKVVEQRLAVEGAVKVAISDLNRDGWSDLVFCPNRQGVQHARRFVTTIYGGPDGWPASRSNGLLPTHDAQDIAVVDLNCDTWPDIAVLNGTAWLPGQPEGRIVRVYWGAEGGFLLTRFIDLGVPNALAMTAADFDRDGAADLAVLRSTGTVRVLWSAPDTKDPAGVAVSEVSLPSPDSGCIAAGDLDGDSIPDLVMGSASGTTIAVRARGDRSWDTPESRSLFPATHVAIADVDDDGNPDLLLTHGGIAHAAGGEAIGAAKDVTGTVRIVWGDAENFSPDRAVSIDVPHASAADAIDLDANGRTDVVVAVYQSDYGTFDANALLFSRGEGRTFAAPLDVGGLSGATDVAVCPPEHDLPARAVFANSQGGHVDERADLLLYWGGEGGFSTSRLERIPFASGYEATAADLNADGLADLIALCSGHAGGETAEAMSQLGANIYLGSKDGFDFSKPDSVLREYNLYSSNVADLDKDGFLDLVLGAFAPPPGQPAPLLVIYYGSERGYSSDRRVAIPAEGRSSICTIADFNRDDWLDIGVTSYDNDCTRLFWGGPDGFSIERQQSLDVPSPIEMETADLNADGWLDLIVGSYEDRIAHHQDTGMLIFWGSASGYAAWNAQWLPGLTPVGITVADWDKDGYLDILSTHYHGELTRERLPSYLYWGGPDGFAPRNRATFTADSPSDALAADFDRDGLLDIAISCHTVDGDHAADSLVIYNDGDRFHSPYVTRLPTVGAHWMWTEDMGHIASRSFVQRYESGVYQWESANERCRIEAEADVPEGAQLVFELKSGTDPAALENQPWRPVEHSTSVASTDRALQFRAVFQSDNGDRFPVLHKVALTLER